MRARLPHAAGVVVPLVFVVVLLMEGLTRPGCNSWRDKGSSLSTGPGGWMQIGNFIACGLLILVPAAFGCTFLGRNIIIALLTIVADVTVHKTPPGALTEVDAPIQSAG